MTKITHKGNFKKTKKSLKRLSKYNYQKKLEEYAEIGVARLSEATPKDTGKTAESWSYVIETDKERSRIVWVNNNVQNGVNVAILLAYGHATRYGAWVEGIDYINPALAPVFDELADEVFLDLTKRKNPYSGKMRVSREEANK